MQYQRNAPDGLYVVGYVIAFNAVASCDGTYQFPIFVCQRDGGPVKLQLTTDFKIFVECLAYTFIEFGDFRFGIGVAQRQHRVFMFHLREVLVQVTAHTYAGRIAVVVFRMSGLQVLQFAHQLVEFLVADDRCVQDIILVVVKMQLFTQLVYSFYFCHGESNDVSCKSNKNVSSHGEGAAEYLYFC